MGIGIALMLTVVPYVHYRDAYTYAKRLHPVTPGKFYRSGCLTEDGFRDAVARYKIRTIINLKDEAPDPALIRNYFDRWHTISESDLCKELNVQFIFLEVKAPRHASEHLQTIAAYLKILDNPANYPILLHCQAGLHRTGMLTAIYRMEYEGWSMNRAYDEMRSHGFGLYNSTSANEYVKEYVLEYRPQRLRNGTDNAVPGEPVHWVPNAKSEAVSH